MTGEQRYKGFTKKDQTLTGLLLCLDMYREKTVKFSHKKQKSER